MVKASVGASILLIISGIAILTAGRIPDANYHLLIIEPESFELGEVHQGETIRGELVVRTDNSAPLVIRPVAESSCSCLQVKSGTGLLPANDALRVSFEVDTSQAPGPFDKNILLIACEQTASARRVVFSVPVRGNVLPEYNLSCDQVVFDSRESTVFVEVMPGFRDDIRINSAFSNCPSVECSILESPSRVCIRVHEAADLSNKSPSKYLLVLTTTSLLQPRKTLKLRLPI